MSGFGRARAPVAICGVLGFFGARNSYKIAYNRIFHPGPADADRASTVPATFSKNGVTRLTSGTIFFGNSLAIKRYSLKFFELTCDRLINFLELGG